MLSWGTQAMQTGWPQVVSKCMGEKKKQGFEQTAKGGKKGVESSSTADNRKKLDEERRGK